MRVSIGRLTLVLKKSSETSCNYRPALIDSEQRKGGAINNLPVWLTITITMILGSPFILGALMILGLFATIIIFPFVSVFLL